MNEKILVVDDEQEIADLVSLYLKNEGYTVFPCTWAQRPWPVWSGRSCLWPFWT